MERTITKEKIRFGGREPLFTQKELLLLTGPLLVEQLLEVTVGMADTMMVSRCGEAAISGVSLVDMINNLIIVCSRRWPPAARWWSASIWGPESRNMRMPAPVSSSCSVACSARRWASSAL